MVNNSEALVTDFLDVLKSLGLVCGGVTVESQKAPHRGHSLPAGKCAVYVFSLSESYGNGCAAGAHRVLKVGKAGPNTKARFHSQHYTGAAPSTLRGSLLIARVLWPYLGVESLSVVNVRTWIEATDRDNFYLKAEEQGLLHELERYLRGRLGPVFEGG